MSQNIDDLLYNITKDIMKLKLSLLKNTHKKNLTDICYFEYMIRLGFGRKKSKNLYR